MPNIEAAKVGDKLAVRERSDGWSRAPHVNNSFYIVGKVTATQLTAVKEGTTHELRFRRSDGAQIGAFSSRYATNAAIATPDLIEAHAQEVAARERYFAASKRMDAVEETMRRRHLTVEQMEAIATAYESTLPT